VVLIEELLRENLGEMAYTTATSKQKRTLPRARVAGHGVYAIGTHKKHTYLVYVLEDVCHSHLTNLPVPLCFHSYVLTSARSLLSHFGHKVECGSEILQYRAPSDYGRQCQESKHRRLQEDRSGEESQSPTPS
jgi:hypothetical protein